MLRTSLFISVLFFTLQMGCFTTPVAQPRKAIQLENIEELRIGYTKQDDLLKKIGSPDKIISTASPNEEIYLYFEEPYKSIPRVSFAIDKKLGLVNTITWWVRPQDPEYELSAAQSRYSKAQFLTKTPSSDNPHVLSNELIYQDKNSELEITYLKSSRRVESISWSDPKLRSVTNTSEK